MAAFDSLSRGELVDLEPSVIAALERWPALEGEFRSLFERASPESIASPALHLALLTRERPDSVLTIREFEIQYGEEIKGVVARPLSLLTTIGGIVAALQSARCQPHFRAPTNSGRFGSRLIEVCAQFTESVTALADLAGISECDE